MGGRRLLECDPHARAQEPRGHPGAEQRSGPAEINVDTHARIWGDPTSHVPSRSPPGSARPRTARRTRSHVHDPARELARRTRRGDRPDPPPADGAASPGAADAPLQPPADRVRLPGPPRARRSVRDAGRHRRRRDRQLPPRPRQGAVHRETRARPDPHRRVAAAPDRRARIGAHRQRREPPAPAPPAAALLSTARRSSATRR